MNSDFFFVSQTQAALEFEDGTLHQGDPLTIFDGPNDQSTQIEKLSGNLGSFIISSAGNSLFVKFESNFFKIETTIGFFASIHYGNPYTLDSLIIVPHVY